MDLFIMTFAELLDHIGGMGRFQLIHVTLLVIPVLMTASHNLLQNFSAAVPGHHCQIRVTTNNTHGTNVTQRLSAKDLLRVSIPMDGDWEPEKCRRFVTAQWQLLNNNATIANGTEMETEPCMDGWTYDMSVFTSTIIMEVRKGLKHSQLLRENLHCLGIIDQYVHSTI